MNILKWDDKKINEKALAVLQAGGLVVSPSDTVYGLLVGATNEQAVKKLIQFKNRPWGKAISVFVADFKMLSENVNVSVNQMNLLRELLPGPFTIVLPSKQQVVKLLESEKGALGVRLPNYELMISLVKNFKKPITATSANLSGRSPHHSLQSLMNELPESKKKLIDLAIDGGQLARNKPSTVLDLTEAKVKIVRRGDIVFAATKKYLSESPSQTKKIAQFLFHKVSAEAVKKPLIFILRGDLGVGKTIFVKGIADLLGIKKIISPTFVIYYEYPSAAALANTLIHIDLYNIEDPEEFKHLGLEKYLQAKNILCFEWGEKSGELMKELKRRGKIIYVDMKYVNEKERGIIISY